MQGGRYFNQNAESYKGDSNWRANSNNPNNAQGLGQNLQNIDWSKEDLKPFQKSFYQDGKSTKTKEEILEFQKKNDIVIRSNHSVPHPFVDWDESYFPDYLIDQIYNAGFQTPTTIQAQSFPILLSGFDLIGIAATGSGKTLSFLLPSIVHINAQPTIKRGDGPIALVLSPTRELAIQIQEECEKFGDTSKLTSCCVYGGADKYPQKIALSRGVDIIIATPGRLIDFLESSTTNLRRVTYLVLDEADRMLDMGFEPQIRKIVGQIRPDRQTAMFSATWPKAIQQMARDFCKENPVHVQIGQFSITVNPDIKQICEIVAYNAKQERVIYHLDTMNKNDKVLIFCQTKRGVEGLFQLLTEEGFKPIQIHGDKSQRDRDRVMDMFRQNKSRILVATDVAQRGLDVRDITYVINYDFPKQVEDYIHRIGRTGRAGDQGTSISFLEEGADKKCAADLIFLLQDAQAEIPEELYTVSGLKRRNYKPNPNRPKQNMNYGPQFPVNTNNIEFKSQPPKFTNSKSNTTDEPNEPNEKNNVKFNNFTSDENVDQQQNSNQYQKNNYNNENNYKKPYNNNYQKSYDNNQNQYNQNKQSYQQNNKNSYQNSNQNYKNNSDNKDQESGEYKSFGFKNSKSDQGSNTQQQSYNNQNNYNKSYGQNNNNQQQQSNQQWRRGNDKF